LVASVTPPLPEELQVEVTGACNLRCRMCLVRYRPPVDRVRGSMTVADFRRILDSVPTVRRVTLQGLGEPLLAPDLFPMIDEARRRGIEVGFNTNATLLSRERCERLVDAGVGWLHVSVDGATAATFEHIRDGARFDKVRRNLATLLAVKRAKSVHEPRVQLNVVAMRRNAAELADLVRLAAELGVARCWVQNLSHDFSDTDPAGEYREIRAFVAREALGEWEAATAFADAREVADALGVELRLPNAGGEAEVLPAEGEPSCDWPWRSAYVTHDGHVQPCCMVMGSDRARLGDVHDEAFAEIWNGAAYREFRAGLLGDTPPAVCRGCAAYRRRF